MNPYTLALFVHVISDITLFIGIGTQLLVFSLLRRARSVESIRALIGLITLTDRIGVAGALFTIASGLYMALTSWNLQVSWIEVALGSILFIIAPLIGVIIEPRTRRLLQLADEMYENPLPPTLAARIQDPALGAALQTNLAIVIGIVFLMTTKPALAGAIIVMGIALVLGIASGVPLWVASRKRSAESR